MKAISAVSLHLHHSLDKTLCILILFTLKNSPISLACFCPIEFKFLCVEQSFKLKLFGSPLPGAYAWRININFPPSSSWFINFLFRRPLSILSALTPFTRILYFPHSIPVFDYTITTVNFLQEHKIKWLISLKKLFIKICVIKIQIRVCWPIFPSHFPVKRV